MRLIRLRILDCGLRIFRNRRSAFCLKEELKIGIAPGDELRQSAIRNPQSAIL